MTYEMLPFNLLPKRQAPVRTWDHAEAAALLAIVTGPGVAGAKGEPTAAPTATDGIAYTDQKLARAAANKTKRLLGRVLPDGKVAKTGIFGLDADGAAVLASDSAGTFGYAVWLIDAKAPKVAAEA